MNDPLASLAAWSDALAAARLFAVDPAALGGVVLRARAGPVRDAWLRHLRESLGDRPWRRLPAHTSEDRLLGGLDLAATLSAGRLIVQRGVLSEADGGVVVVPMAERISATATGALSSALDREEVILERDGLTERSPARIGVVLLDEGIDDERVPTALADRLSVHLNLDGLKWSDIPDEASVSPEEGRPAAGDWRAVDASPEVIEGLCGAAHVLGIVSMRAPLAAVRVARASAALAGRASIDEEDLQLAARLVLAPRATRMPASEEDEPPPEPPPPEPESEDTPPSEGPDELQGQMADVVLAAVESAMPAGLLAQLAIARQARASSRAMGTAGQMVATRQRGRPAGTRRGHPRQGGRLNVVETLRAAAPWQRVRKDRASARVQVRQDDFRVTRYKRRTETLTVFAVDASGSSALQRLAEAKGAVEQVLAECYVRRDHVALIAFRGAEADLLLPPTRSLVRAKRSLASMAGGGATPLATGLDAARSLAEDARRRGRSPVIVVMTDGRANIGRDGEPNRSQAGDDALHAARLLAEASIPGLLVDTAPRPRRETRQLSEAMGARYLHLPYADNRAIAAWVSGIGGGA